MRHHCGHAIAGAPSCSDVEAAILHVCCSGAEGLLHTINTCTCLLTTLMLLLLLQIRGVRVGSTMRVEPSLERVDVLVEVTEPTTVIPRNALIEANQSGLIAEPLIDITPQTPIPDWKARQPAMLKLRQIFLTCSCS